MMQVLFGPKTPLKARRVDVDSSLTCPNQLQRQLKVKSLYLICHHARKSRVLNSLNAAFQVV